MTTSRSDRILYVEDDEDIREMMASFLTDEGYAVTSFRTAEDGLEGLERDGCELLLTDYVLPGEDAAWLLGEARRRNLLLGVPIIVVSAEYRPVGIQGAKFLHKPVKAEVLLAAIEEALQARRGSSAPPATVSTAHLAPTLDLALYVSTPSHDSETAKRNLGRIVRSIGPENVRVVVHDIASGSPEALRAIEEDRIVVVPTLVKRGPGPTVWIAGDLSKREYVTNLLSSALGPARRAAE
jgi:DNA-binding NtrC family response regulator